MVNPLSRTLAELTGQGWQITNHSYRRVVLSRPYPNRWHLASWDVGVILVSLFLACTAARVPPQGTMVMGVVSIAGIAWGLISMILWRRPVWVITLTGDGRGNWHQSEPTLQRG